VPTRYPACDWRYDKPAMIIGPSQGILYAGFNENAVTGHSQAPDGRRITAYYLHHPSPVSIYPFSPSPLSMDHLFRAGMKDGVIPRVLNQGVLSSRQHQMYLDL
jgi:hypothetical protein